MGKLGHAFPAALARSPVVIGGEDAAGAELRAEFGLGEVEDDLSLASDFVTGGGRQNDFLIANDYGESLRLFSFINLLYFLLIIKIKFCSF